MNEKNLDKSEVMEGITGNEISKSQGRVRNSADNR